MTPVRAIISCGRKSVMRVRVRSRKLASRLSRMRSVPRSNGRPKLPVLLKRRRLLPQHRKPRPLLLRRRPVRRLQRRGRQSPHVRRHRPSARTVAPRLLAIAIIVLVGVPVIVRARRAWILVSRRARVAVRSRSSFLVRPVRRPLPTAAPAK